jgi:hypothetical protein
MRSSTVLAAMLLVGGCGGEGEKPTVPTDRRAQIPPRETGPVVAELVSAEYLTIPVRPMNEFRTEWTPQRCLVVRFKLTNTAKDRRYFYQHDATPSLTDTQRNEYPYRVVDYEALGRGSEGRVSIDPGESVEDVYAFEGPMIPADAFTLRIPGRDITTQTASGAESDHPDILIAIVVKAIR